MFNSITETVGALFVFCIVLFLYLHVQFHLKTSNELEMYEIEDCSKDKMEEICDLRQPTLFDFPSASIVSSRLNQSALLSQYPTFDVKIKRAISKEKEKDQQGKEGKEERQNKEEEQKDGVPLALHLACKLFGDDERQGYFSEGNGDFLQETGAEKQMSYNDAFLRPALVSNCGYDVLFGSARAETPLKYELNYRNFFLVTAGSVEVKLSPPKSGKHLYSTKDYERFEFSSPVNPWAPQERYQAEFDKSKWLTFVLVPGQVLYIPAYWWYSFRFQAPATTLCSFKYRTYMNNVAISPQVFLSALQSQNVVHKLAKTSEQVAVQDGK